MVTSRDPLLIGLQEVSRWDAISATGRNQFDFLTILLDALEGRGLHYEAVAISDAFEDTLLSGAMFGARRRTGA